jgi:two-component system, NtrC family, response regulator AtoC
MPGSILTANPSFHQSDASFELPPEPVIFGSSRLMLHTRKTLERAAGVNIPLLLQGQSGTGKEIIARYVHRRSPWNNGDFIKVNCPAIPGGLFESELFGYERGAFTDAHTSKPGRVEMAHGGTLFLDEIADLEFGIQAKLLELLQENRFCRIGAQRTRQVEFRAICATNRDLEREIRDGNFRQDLLFRINVVSIELPPLEQRKEDLPMLTSYFLERYARLFGRPATRPSKHMMTVFETYHWPGNIRELENVIKRFVILGSEQEVFKVLTGNCEQAQKDFEAEVPNGSVSLKELTRQTVGRLEKRVILNTLEANHWNRRAVSRALGISYAALLYKMRRAGIPARYSYRTLEEAGSEKKFS